MGDDLRKKRHTEPEGAGDHSLPVVASQQELQEITTAAELFAREAGECIMSYAAQLPSLHIDTKQDNSPVTAADRETERLLRDRIARRYPDDSILGEELGEKRGTSGRTWIIDPIDGTKSFVAGIPLYTTLIAVSFPGRSECGSPIPTIGVIHNPNSRETVAAHIGGGCTLNGIPTRIRSPRPFSEALLMTSDPADLLRREQSFGLALMEQAQMVRTWADGYGYLMVATGRADIMLDPIMNAWDVAALGPVVSEAGGRLTALDGTPTWLGQSALAAAPSLHQEALAMRRQCLSQA